MRSFSVNILRQNILGVDVSAIDVPMALETIHQWVQARERQYICVAPAHSVMDAYNTPALRVIMNTSGMVTPDGMGIVWLLNLHGHRYVRRVYGPDLVIAVCEMGIQYGNRHYLYGGEDGVANSMASRLMNMMPGLQITGSYSPSYEPGHQIEDEDVVEMLNAYSADIVWVGQFTKTGILDGAASWENHRPGDDRRRSCI